MICRIPIVYNWTVVGTVLDVFVWIRIIKTTHNSAHIRIKSALPRVCDISVVGTVLHNGIIVSRRKKSNNASKKQRIAYIPSERSTPHVHAVLDCAVSLGWITKSNDSSSQKYRQSHCMNSWLSRKSLGWHSWWWVLLKFRIIQQNEMWSSLWSCWSHVPVNQRHHESNCNNNHQSAQRTSQQETNQSRGKQSSQSNSFHCSQRIQRRRSHLHLINGTHPPEHFHGGGTVQARGRLFLDFLISSNLQIKGG